MIQRLNRAALTIIIIVVRPVTIDALAHICTCDVHSCTPNSTTITCFRGNIARSFVIVMRKLWSTTRN